jgi:hypothetical protein
MPESTSANGWRKYRFDEMAVMVNDRIDDPSEANVEYYVGLEHLDSESLTIHRWGSPSDVEATKLRFRAGDIIFGRRRVYQRKLAVAHFDGICSAHAMVLRARSEVALAEFLPFFMQSDLFMERAKEISVGSLSPTINWKSLAKEEFALPPLEEQQRIAGVVAAADCTAESLMELLEAARLAEGSLFAELVARCNAQEITLGSLLMESPRNGCSATETSAPTGHWVLSLSALTRWRYRPGELKPVEKTDAMAAAVLRQGDLLISRSNTRDLVGLPGVFDENRTDVSWPDTMMRLTPDESRLRKRFLELFLRSPAGRRQVQSFAAGTSASMKKINATNVKKLLIPLPKPEVQDSIESKSEPFRQARDLTQRRISELMDFKRTLLNHALSPAAREGV